MYDSEEVRDAVRRDALAIFVQRTGAFQGFADLSPVEQATINEAVTAEGNPWQRALREYLEERAARSRVNMLEQIAEAIMTWLRPLMEEALEVMRSFFFQVGEVVDAARRAMAELAEAAGLLEKPEPFVWQRRSRQPDVRPVQSVDAVAAGRSPSAWFRTRMRGGRR
jgi:hypothetical protein